jgi:ribosomal protein S12 methylthiotransferase accessory factor
MKVFPLNQFTAMWKMLEPYIFLVNPALGPVYGIISHNSLDSSGLPGWITLLVNYKLNQVIKFLTTENKITLLMEYRASRRRSFVPAGGKGLDKVSAVVGGIGEFIERYIGVLAFFYDYSLGKIIYGTALDLERQGYRVLRPENLPLFAPEQYAEPGFPFARWRENTYIGWVRGYTLPRKEEILIPASIVYMAYGAREGEEIIAYPTSGGLSYRASREEAIFHGILELIERDAVNLFWICRCPATRIQIDLDELGFRSPFVHKDNLYLLKMRTDVPGIHVVHSMYFNETDSVFLGGGAADTNLIRAICKACLELKQSAFSSRMLLLGPRREISKEELVDFFDVIPYYSIPKRMRKLKQDVRRLIGEEVAIVDEYVDQPTSLPDMGLEDWVVSLGLEPIIVYEFDLPALGIPHGHLVKVVIPSLTLPGVPRWPFLGHPRYYNAPYEWGIVLRPLRYEQLNLEPLPFP